jgi:hypothetical protein
LSVSLAALFSFSLFAISLSLSPVFSTLLYMAESFFPRA